MKILIIWHSGANPEYQKRIEALAERQNTEVTLFVPERYPENGVVYMYTKTGNKKFEYYKGKTVFSGKIMWYFYLTGLFRVFMKKKYDIIEMIEEPYSVSAFQITLFKYLFQKEAKLIFNTAQNQRLQFKNIFPLFLSKIFKRSPLVSKKKKEKEKFPFPLNIFQKFVLQNSDAAIIRTKRTKRILQTKGFEKPLVFIGNGVDIKKTFFPKKNIKLRQKIGLKKFTIGYIGKIEEKKGLITLIRACGILNFDFQLFFLGYGTGKKEIFENIKKEKIEDKFIFHSAVEQNRIPDFMNCIDLFILPSITTKLWVEMFGRVIIEAMACGVPVIGSSSGGIPDTVKNAGLIFPEKKYKELAVLIEKIYRSKDLYREYQKRGQVRAAEFSWDKIAEQTKEFYVKIREEN